MTLFSINLELFIYNKISLNTTIMLNKFPCMPKTGGANDLHY